VNGTVALLTLRGMLGRRRVLLLLALPATLLLLAVVLRTAGFGGEGAAGLLLQRYGLGTLLPLVALIAGTGVLGPEIEDGTIVFLLSKPLSRSVIVHSKLAVAAATTVLFAAVPVLIAGLVMTGTDGGVTVGFAAGALAGSLAYAAIFVLVNVLTRHAVVAGVLYALVWESLVGGFVPGARELSVQQWALSVASAVSAHGLHADVPLLAALPLLIVATVGATALAGERLRSLTIAD
jgi:ABC-2 type transport system permease protein